ncbi:hypothetical protein KKF32_02495 [Patescibacteria group bacterium]|nr:hypothetical protein [Patescibacteria group bacterium]
MSLSSIPFSRLPFATPVPFGRHDVIVKIDPESPWGSRILRTFPQAIRIKRTLQTEDIKCHNPLCPQNVHQNGHRGIIIYDANNSILAEFCCDTCLQAVYNSNSEPSP